MMGDLGTSLVRTVVPAVVGWLIALAAKAQIELDAAELEAVLTPVAIGLYYFVGRLLERRRAWFGWLLGVPKQPSY